MPLSEETKNLLAHERGEGDRVIDLQWLWRDIKQNKLNIARHNTWNSILKHWPKIR